MKFIIEEVGFNQLYGYGIPGYWIRVHSEETPNQSFVVFGLQRETLNSPTTIRKAIENSIKESEKAKMLHALFEQERQNTHNLMKRLEGQTV